MLIQLHRLLCFSFLSCTIMLIIGCSFSDDENREDDKDIVHVGDILPTFSIVMNNNQIINTDNLTDKPTMIIFFNTQCQDCQRELPTINQRYIMHGSDTTFIAISREQVNTEIKNYWETHGFSLPYSAQPDRKIYSLFAKQGIPRIYIADKNRKIKEIIARW